jgi:protein gp37
MKVAYRHELQSAGAGRISPYAGLTTKTKAGAVWTGEIRMNEHALALPLRWKRARRIFVNSMSDLFHEGLPDVAIDRVFAVMALGPQHTFQILTKRAERLRDYLSTPQRQQRIAAAAMSVTDNPRAASTIESLAWPFRNIWLGVSVEDQARGDERIPMLLQTPAAIRFLSCEPLLGPVDLAAAASGYGMPDWVIIGGESGPKARRFDLAWARSLAAQCKATGTACFVKQLGARPYDATARDIDAGYKLKDRKGGDWDEWPADLRRRDFPDIAA